MSEDQFESVMRDAALTYNRPPEPPLEEMWREVAPGRVERASRWTTWRAASLAAAAALVLGVALGRASSRLGVSAPTTESLSVASAQPTSRPRAEETIATSQYIGQTTALLIALPSELQQRHPDSSFVTRANDLLLTTRLLLDSPAAADSSMHGLFEDLELVLAQVVRLQDNRTPAEVDLITQALEQHDVMPRLENAAANE